MKRRLPHESYPKTMPFAIRFPTGDTRGYPTFKRAYEAAHNNDAWKIEFANYRWIRKTHLNKWTPFEEAKLLTISPKYLKFNNDPNVLFWVWQRVLALDWEAIYVRSDLTDDEKAQKERESCIIEVITDAELYERFRDFQP